MRAALVVTLTAAIAIVGSKPAAADAGGISFWLPGLFGSLTAVPSTPGWTWQTVYIHNSSEADANKVFPRGGRVEVGLGGRGNLVAFGPSYVFSEPFLGAQAAINVLAVGGRLDASVSATLTGPGGVPISGSRSDTRTGFGDVLPMVSLKWNQGVHNYMTYLTGNIPVGAYDANRLANLGLGHGAIDWGVAYTYLNPQTGWEFSAATGFTYNFRNPDTDYQNGIDWHVDWGASYFITKQVHIGLVGYLYQQITGDSGSGAVLGDFKSRVAGIGPQIGYMFPLGDMHAYVNLKGYKEFAAENRPEGWSVWLAFAVSPAAHPAARPVAMVRK
jgi:hypothetical protein